MEKFKQVAIIILLFILSFPAIRSLLVPGFFPMHDDTQPTRVYEMAKALRDGQFPVRWVEDLGYGYGYPIFNFYAPLPYYVGAFGVLGGLDVLVATKIIFALGILLSGISMFILGNKLWGRAGGIISAIFYIYAPYHAVQIYVRGAVGEYWAYAFLPLLAYGVLENKNWRKKVLIGGIGIAGVILSHNITGMITFWFLFILVVIKSLEAFIFRKPVKSIYANVCMVLVGLGLSAFYWLPAVLEAKFTKAQSLILGGSDYRQHFVFPDQFWNSPWGFAGSGPERADGMSFMVGKLHLIIALIVLIGLGHMVEKNRQKYFSTVVLVAISSLISLLMMLPNSKIIWETIPFAAYIQYPWRLLTFTTFFLSFIAGGIVYLLNFRTRIKRLVVLIIVLGVILFNLRYFKPQFISLIYSTKYTEDQVIKWNISKISDEYLPKEFPVPINESAVSSEKINFPNDIMIDNSEFRSHFVKLSISAKNQAEIVFSIADFPGWVTVVDSKRVEHLTKDGKLAVTVPAGKHIVTAYFGNTPVRTVANVISLATLIFSIVLYKKIYEKN